MKRAHPACRINLSNMAMDHCRWDFIWEGWTLRSKSENACTYFLLYPRFNFRIRLVSNENTHNSTVTDVWHWFHFPVVYIKNRVIIIVVCPVDYVLHFLRIWHYLSIRQTISTTVTKENSVYRDFQKFIRGFSVRPTSFKHSIFFDVFSF